MNEQSVQKSERETHQEAIQDGETLGLIDDIVRNMEWGAANGGGSICILSRPQCKR